MSFKETSYVEIAKISTSRQNGCRQGFAYNFPDYFALLKIHLSSTSNDPYHLELHSIC